jgi:hypothetical protein
MNNKLYNTICIIIGIIVVSLIFIIWNSSQIEHFDGKGGMLISPLGLPEMYDHQVVSPVLKPDGYNQYYNQLPDNQIEPTIFYRYYYLERYYLSILYQICQEIENQYPQELINKLANNKISIDQMDLINNIKSPENKKWLSTIEYTLKYIARKYPHIDIPFIYNTTTIYKYDIPIELENYIDSSDKNKTKQPIHLIQFTIRKNFHYLLAIEANGTPKELTMYIKFTYDENTNEPRLILCRVKEIYDQYTPRFESANQERYTQFVDEPEQELGLTEQQIDDKVSERQKFYQQGQRSKCRRRDRNIGKMLDEVIPVPDKINCIIEGGVWDSPCIKNTDCPFYKANKNFPNEFGGCNSQTGYCELPIGLNPVGYRSYDNIENAETYNCDKGYYGEKSIGKCVLEQLDKVYSENTKDTSKEIEKLEIQPKQKFKSPDFVFMGDMLIRKKFSDLLMDNGLNWNDA